MTGRQPEALATEAPAPLPTEPYLALGGKISRAPRLKPNGGTHSSGTVTELDWMLFNASYITRDACVSRSPFRPRCFSPTRYQLGISLLPT